MQTGHIGGFRADRIQTHKDLARMGQYSPAGIGGLSTLAASLKQTEIKLLLKVCNGMT